jgi:hypothetical protein
MNNRYNELSKLQQALFDQMINSVASHKNTFADSLTEKAHSYFEKTVKEMWAELPKVGSGRASKTDTTPVTFVRQGK